MALVRRFHPLRISAVIFLGLSLGLSMAGCSSIADLNPFGPEKYETKVLKETPADDIYNEGLLRLQKHDPAGAAKRFSEIEKQHPYSGYNEKGLLMSAYANFKAGAFDEAISSANRFYTLFPNSPDAPYALYIAAECYYAQVPVVSRDQENSQKALDLYQKIVDKYPTSEYADDAKFKIQVVNDQLAGKEMSVGRFYLARKNYTAAINRFRVVLAKYQRTRHTEEALERLTEAYLGLGITNEAQTAAAVLGHNFPDSQWYKDALAQLQGTGLEPSEDQGSWISQWARKLGMG